jgi:hypothetical protein
MTFAIVKGDTEGELLGAVAMARDVTERVERERAVSRSTWPLRWTIRGVLERGSSHGEIGYRGP